MHDADTGHRHHKIYESALECFTLEMIKKFNGKRQNKIKRPWVDSNHQPFG